MPAINSRNASISSCSTSSEPIKKKFACLFEGCLKSFSRSEHLHRHSLNHKEGTNTCARCSAHFRRRDLLDRHMVRHKEKDDEAGGEGLGHLATRKRLWRDADGKIINGRRPFETLGTRRHNRSTSVTGLKCESNGEQKSMDALSGTRKIPGRARVRHVNRKEPPPEPLQLDESVQVADGDHLEFMEANDWTMQTDENAFVSSNLSYDNIKQEPGFTYNSPFTTMNYYSWLFEHDQSNGTPNQLQTSLESSNNQALMDVPSACSSSYSPSIGSYSECVSPTSLDPNLLSRKNSLSSDAFLPLSILAEGAASMRRHTLAGNLPPPLKHSPPIAMDPRRESHSTHSNTREHVNFPARIQKPFFDYDGSSLFSDSAVPDMYHSRNVSNASTRLSSPIHTPSLSSVEFASAIETKYRDILSHETHDTDLSELMAL